ncbi:hypothetical protein AGMMS49940_23350 [Spirochaetia bacterium]|nr:hypothetical protein AGMMS49940_23350 [Spirochaetia bacterium]
MGYNLTMEIAIQEIDMTRNSEGNTVLKDDKTDRLAGIKGYSINEFRENMEMAIAQGNKFPGPKGENENP